MDRNHTGKRIGVLLLFILIAGAIYFWEENHVRLLFAGISPFPEDDYWNTLVNALLRDVVLLIAGGLFFFAPETDTGPGAALFPSGSAGGGLFGLCLVYAAKACAGSLFFNNTGHLCRPAE